MVMETTSAHLVGSVDPTATLLIVSIALALAIFANTYHSRLVNPSYFWQYGLFKLIAYGGMIVLSFVTAGIGAAVPSAATFLGMELQRLMQILDINWISGLFNGKNGKNGKNEKSGIANS
jgi:hypothetical protein